MKTPLRKNSRKGIRNKKSWRLLHELRDRDFDIVEEFVRLYEEQRSIATPLYQRLEKAVKDGIPLEEALTRAERDMLKETWGAQYQILAKLVSYVYPRLANLQVGNDAGDQIVFNLQMPPGVHIEAPKNVTPKEKKEMPSKKAKKDEGKVRVLKPNEGIINLD